MNQEAIGAIGEILDAIAVVLTLVYLATQVRYAKEAASDNNRIARAAGIREMLLAQATNSELKEFELKMADTTFFQELAGEFDISLEQAYALDKQNGYWFWLHWGQNASTTSVEDKEKIENLVRNFYTIPSVLFSWRNSP